jgi:uncharacterized protein YbjT (DUF2867 family)
MARDSIVIAGATGFIGNAVARLLSRRTDSLEVVGLTRGRREATGAWDRLVTCDLFSLKDVEQAVTGARYVVYLVHSMAPSARLVQGSFEDLDLICADNMGRAAAKAGVEQIIYLGGLIPEDQGNLSAHLESRREVERALGAHGVAVTSLRAGMVIGAGGSSFEIMKRLVERLPAMVLPGWTEHRCQAIDLDTVASLVAYVVGRRDAYGQTFDVGGPDALTYREMLATMGELLGRKRRAVGVPLLSPKLSRLWVSLITGAPRALVRPLIESLHHDMVCRDRRLQLQAELPGLPFREAAAEAIDAERATPATDKPVAYQKAPASPQRQVGVRSVQRIPLPAGRDAEWAAHEYMRWLPDGVWPGLRVQVDSDRTASFYAPVFAGKPLLVLRFAAERSASDRQLFYVVGGRLARPSKRGRLEFRVTPDGSHLLTAIHDFVPSLPWWLYRLTQAIVHAAVMRRFGAHLGALEPVAPGPRQVRHAS